MRNGVIGVASSILLSGVVAFGPALGQATESAAQGGQTQTSSEGAGQAEGSGQKPAPPQAAAPGDNVDCVRFTSPLRCEGHLVIRSTQPLRAKAFSLKAVLTTPEGSAVPVSVQVQCEGCSGDQVSIGNVPAIVVPFTLTLPDDWHSRWRPKVATGFIGPTSGSNLFDGTPRRLRVLASSPSGWQTLVVLLPAILATLMVAAVAVKLFPLVTPSHRMGAPSWKPSESWSSNLTVGAGLVTGAIALVTSDLTVFMTKPSYGVVSMLFASLVLLAPIVYGLSRTPVQKSDALKFEGPVGAFLAAGLLTVWASGGQLLAFALIIGEIWRARTISGEVASLVIALTLIVFAALLKYGYSSMVDAAARARRPGSVPATGVVRESVTTDAPPWSLL